MAEAMRAVSASMLKGIDRYNPANLSTLERYVQMQTKDNLYDLEANLSVLKLYQFNNNLKQLDIVMQILLKALTNLPHTDFVLCKCLLVQGALENENIERILELHNLLETCRFTDFWVAINPNKIETVIPKAIDEKNNYDMTPDQALQKTVAISATKDCITLITGFNDSIRKFICHVVNITYQRIEKHVLQDILGGLSESDLRQWMNKYGWKDLGNGLIFIANQEENIKTKNITEKIEFESVAAIMAASR